MQCKLRYKEVNETRREEKYVFSPLYYMPLPQGRDFHIKRTGVLCLPVRIKKAGYVPLVQPQKKGSLRSTFT